MQNQTSAQGMEGKLTLEPKAYQAMPQVVQGEKSLAAGMAAIFRLLARISFGAVIVLAPLRSAIILLPHALPPVYSDYTNGLLFPSDPFLVLALVFWFASLALQRRRLILRPLGLTIPIAALTAVSLLSVAFSADRLVSAYQSLRLLLLAGLYLMVLNEIRSFFWVAVPAGLMVLSQSIVGILQVLRQHSLGLTWLHELSLDPSWNGVSIVWTVTTRSLRAYGLTDHPNILGGLLALGLIFLATWYLESHETLRPVVGSVFALGVIGLLVTFSRSAYLGLLFGLLLIAGWLWFSRRRQVFTRFILLGAGTLVLLAPFLWQNAANLGIRFGFQNSFTAPTAENQAINERLMLNVAGSTIFFAHPLFGVGLGAFPVALYQADPTYTLNFQPPHLVLVDVAAETGIFGALAYLAIELFPWVYMVLRRKQIRFTPALVGASAALLAVSVISLFDYYPWMLNPGRLWQWAIWGLWAGLVAESSTKDVLHA